MGMISCHSVPQTSDDTISLHWLLICPLGLVSWVYIVKNCPQLQGCIRHEWTKNHHWIVLFICSEICEKDRQISQILMLTLKISLQDKFPKDHHSPLHGSEISFWMVKVSNHPFSMAYCVDKILLSKSGLHKQKAKRWLDSGVTTFVSGAYLEC